MSMRPLALATLLALSAAAVHAQDEGGGGSRFHVGLNFVSGVSDLDDKIEQNNPSVQSSRLSRVGLAFSGYYLMDGGFGIGGGIGPAFAATGDASYTIIPVSVGGRWQFVRTDSMAGYAGVAVEKYFVSGDFVDGGKAGLAVALGLEFGKPRGLGWGVELSAHSATVKVTGTAFHAEQTTKPAKAQLGVFFLF